MKTAGELSIELLLKSKEHEEKHQNEAIEKQLKEVFLFGFLCGVEKPYTYVLDNAEEIECEWERKRSELAAYMIANGVPMNVFTHRVVNQMLDDRESYRGKK